MTEDKSTKIAVMFNNTIRILAFVTISVIFERWWLVLLALFFLE